MQIVKPKNTIVPKDRSIEYFVMKLEKQKLLASAMGHDTSSIDVKKTAERFASTLNESSVSSFKKVHKEKSRNSMFKVNQSPELFTID